MDMHTQNRNSLLVYDITFHEFAEEWHTPIRAMLEKRSEIGDGRLWKLQATEHYIDLKPDNEPVWQKLYWAGHKERDFLQEEIKKMLYARTISPSDLKLASSLVLTPKSDGYLRFCIDYRRLNAVSKRESYTLPRVDDWMESLGEVHIFTTLDTNLGY